mgnify:CR=1 FL=1
MKTVKVTYDDSIVQKLRNAFTSIDCIFTEAMQNARRANASHVHFDTSTPGQLIIRDNGDGIADLQDFLTLAGSGWDEETIDREGAFGMGSFALLYAAEYIKVESNGQCFEGETRVLLNGHDFNLSDSDVKSGTVITMTLNDLPDDEDFFNLISKLAKGFQIDVFVNGVQCKQYHRLTDDFVDIGLGKAFIPGISIAESLPSYTNGSTLLYFQGLRVDKQRHKTTPYTIVHLDEQLFEVRMPDRDVLIDQEKQNKLIEEKINATWVDYLTAKKAELNSDEFVKLYSQMRQYGCLSLLNDVPLVPEEALFVVPESPHCERRDYDENFAKERSVHRNDIGKVLAIESYVDDETIYQWQYAYHTEALCYQESSLDKGHWLHAHIVIDSDNSGSVAVIYSDKKTVTSYRGEFVWMGCEFGDKVLINGPLGEVEVVDDVIFFKDTMYIPADFKDGSAILKANSFTNNDSFDDTAYQNEEQIFGAFLMRHNGSVLEAFKAALDNPYINGLGFNDKQFKVVFHAKGFEVEEIAA